MHCYDGTAMVRMQIQFSDEQAVELRRIAARRRVSIAALTREAVDSFISEREGRSLEERREQLLEALGSFEGDGSNVAIEHDRFLDEIYGDRG